LHGFKALRPIYRKQPLEAILEEVNPSLSGKLLPPSGLLKAFKSTLKRKIKTIKKALQAAHAQLEKCHHWQLCKHEADLLQSHLYEIKPKQTFITIEDWQTSKTRTFSLNPQWLPHEEIAKKYKTAKKWQKGLPFAEQMAAKIEADLKLKECLLTTLESFTTDAEAESFIKQHELPKPQQKHDKKQIQAQKPYREFFSRSHIAIWVGKSSAKNDSLTFQHAKGNDLWMHVANYSGSHVIVLLRNQQECDPETLQAAMQLALHFSKAQKHQEGEISMTYVKHVRRLGKEKGKVQIAHEKRVFIKKNDQILNYFLNKFMI
jgi:predicted ribosome quality control (RQC) complex YloA/Tae2 family protein